MEHISPFHEVVFSLEFLIVDIFHQARYTMTLAYCIVLKIATSQQVNVLSIPIMHWKKLEEKIKM